MSDNTTAGILQPGQLIKPNVTDEQAKQLIQEYYGCEVTKIKKINSYDDSNYYVEAATTNGNNEKFIFKILNSLDSQKPWHVEAENECMQYLYNEKGINCPLPLPNNLDGKTWFLAPIPCNGADSENNDMKNSSKDHIIRLLRYVEGKLLVDVPITRKLLMGTGSYVSKLGLDLQGFSHDGVKNKNTMWMLASVPKLLQFSYVFEDQPAKLKLIKEIISAFKSRVEASYPKLEKGLIHGDLNEQNILVQPVAVGSKEFAIHGIIDFGDTQESYYIFELAISMAYLMLQCLGTEIDPLEGGGLLLQGYSQHRKIPKLELEILRTCIAGRLCQSLVMGAYTYSKDPGNEYLLTTAKTGWDMLNRIWVEKTDEQLKSIWKL
jgi:hydroxylysine kinase